MSQSNHTTSSANGASANDKASRRKFVGVGAASTAALASMVHTSRAVADDAREIRIGLVGCGGRGRGAVKDSLSINSNVKLVAVADLYEKNAGYAVTASQKAFPDKVDVAEDRVFIGLDAYKRILDDHTIDVVMFATSPGFRPPYVLEAVQAGKHVFAEKPSCVDAAGYHKCLQAHDLAVKSNTAIVTGTQYRRQTNYIAAVKKIREGAIGDIVGASTRYCTGGIWFRKREEGMSDTEYQLHNWMHYVWLSGDQIAEQAVHNIDAINWIMGGPPVSAYGGGGRHQRPENSELWDSFSIDYKYPGDRMCSFMCRQLPDTKYDNGNIIYGSEGTMHIGAINAGSKMFDRQGEELWRADGKISDAYQQEHKDLVDSIRSGNPIVELKETADSSLTAVMGRVAAYTGQEVTWDFLTKESKLDLFPKKLDWNGEMEIQKYAVPGKTKNV